MRTTQGRPAARLFYFLAAILLAALGLRAADIPPATTLISDTVYRANGTAAGGTLVISWPAFETAEHKTVAAGVLSVTLGEGGSLNVPLVPNQGATPLGTYYRVVTKLDDGTTTTEFWNVPNISPATVASVRTTIAPIAPAAPSTNYVQQAEVSNDPLPNKIPRAAADAKLDAGWLPSTVALNADVLHIAGAETIAGLKTFAQQPLGVAGGADKQVQFDAAGALAGDPRFSFDPAAGVLSVGPVSSSFTDDFNREFPRGFGTLEVTQVGNTPNTSISKAAIRGGYEETANNTGWGGAGTYGYGVSNPALGISQGLVRGVDADAFKFGEGFISNLAAVTPYVQVEAGTVGMAADIFSVGIVKHGGTIHKAYGLYLANDFGSLGDTESAAIRIVPQSDGENNFAIKVEGGKSYFAGNVGIGKTPSLANLDVNGSAAFSGTVSGGDYLLGGLTFSRLGENPANGAPYLGYNIVWNNANGRYEYVANGSLGAIVPTSSSVSIYAGDAASAGDPAPAAMATVTSSGMGLRGYFDVNEIAAPATPATGVERWYADSTTHTLSCLTSTGGNCNPSSGPGGGVSSVNGDGALITNSSSNGSVTLALGNAAAHKFWGNNSGASAAPGYETIGNADLPGSGATTINGTSCALGGSCTATASLTSDPTGCTNQAVTDIAQNGALTCTTVTSSYVDTSIAKTGIDINTSNQVSATHLAAALPVNQGGTGTTSTLAGFLRGNASAMTATELSGDVSTSGSGVVTLAHPYLLTFSIAGTGGPSCSNGGGTTTFIGLQGASSTTETSVARFVAPEAFVASKMYAQLGGNVPTGETVTLTLNDNTAATAITFTIAAGSSANSDSAHIATMVPGHLYDVALNCRSGTTAITGPVHIALALK